jgi:hypothetical protein
MSILDKAKRAYARVKEQGIPQEDVTNPHSPGYEINEINEKSPIVLPLRELRAGEPYEINEIDEISPLSRVPFGAPGPDVWPCYYAGRHRRRWRSIHGMTLCGICAPPAHPGVVAEWLDGEGA